MKFKYNHFFKVVIILIIFLHGHYLNFTYEIIVQHTYNLVDYGWDKYFQLQV
jgi:hypothetical protein